MLGQVSDIYQEQDGNYYIIKLEKVIKAEKEIPYFPDETAYVFELTPRGCVIMRYISEHKRFEYWADASLIPFDILETVARKYVTIYRCRDAYIEREEFKKRRLEKEAEEAEEFESDYSEVEIEGDETSETDEMEETEEVETTPAEPEKNNPFATFKNYNSAGGKGGLGKDKHADMENKSCNFLCKGKFYEFQMLNVPELESPVQTITFSDFKKMSMK